MSEMSPHPAEWPELTDEEAYDWLERIHQEEISKLAAVAVAYGAASPETDAQINRADSVARALDCLRREKRRKAC